MDRATHQAVDGGRARWPGVSLSEDDFARHLQASNIGSEVVRTLGEDLFLSAACASGDAAALAHFETAFLSHVPQYVGRLALSEHELDELRQRLRLDLLVGPSPKVGAYRGAGPLGAWVRVCAVRVALKIKAEAGGGRAAQGDPAAMDALVTAGADPEFLAAKGQHREAFGKALEEAFLGLSARQKTLLRMHFVDAMSIDDMGTVFRVHRATVARWLVAVRTQVLTHVRRHVALNVRTTSSEFKSLFDLLKSDIHLSLSRVLAETSSRQQ